MSKKIIIPIIVILILVIAGGGFFWWWQDQVGVRKLNKNLPEGVRVVKSLIEEEYRVVNKIDGYEFEVPKEWGGLKGVEYFVEGDMNAFSIQGISGDLEHYVAIAQYKLAQPNITLDSWTEEWIQKFKEFVWERENLKVGDFTVIKLVEEEHLGGIISYFFKEDLKIYEVNGMSEEFIKEIILNGKW